MHTRFIYFPLKFSPLCRLILEEKGVDLKKVRINRVEREIQQNILNRRDVGIDTAVNYHRHVFNNAILSRTSYSRSMPGSQNFPAGGKRWPLGKGIHHPSFHHRPPIEQGEGSSCNEVQQGRA